MFQDTYRDNLKEIILAGREIFFPRQKIPVSVWAETKRVLSKEESARPGLWDNRVTPFAVEILDAFNDNKVERITGMFSAQVVKTEIIKNIIGYIIDEEPAPILVVYPTDGDARDFSVEKLEPMLNHNPFLKNKIAPYKSNSKDNKTLYKKFVGGFLAIVGGRVPQDLARRSVKYVFADDRDRIGVAGFEGDAISLAWQRTESFALLGRKLIEFSTPTIEGESPIKNSYLKSDQRMYYVPCPFCNEYQTIEFENLIWEKDTDFAGDTIKHYPETTKLKCKHCEQLIDEKYKYEMITNGKWIAKFPEITNHRGYWLNRMYSLFSPWRSIVQEFLDKKNDKSELQVFYNTVLALTWKRDETEELDNVGLIERCENYLTNENPYLPKEILVLVIAVDTQPDRLEYQVIGFGKQYEAWAVEYEVLYGDPDQEEVWNALEEVQLKKSWMREDGVKLKLNWKPGLHFPVVIDSGGRNTQSVYRQCKKRFALGWLAIKGVGGSDKPILLNMSPVGPARDVRLQNIGVDSAKTLVHKMIKTNQAPAKIHFTHAFCNYEYFQQLTNERVVKELNKKTNRFHYVWKKKSEHARVEVLDTWAYAFACVMKLNPKFDLIEKKLLETKTEREQNENKITEHRKVIRRRITARRLA